jgi:hypothetical protein
MEIEYYQKKINLNEKPEDFEELKNAIKNRLKLNDDEFNNMKIQWDDGTEIENEDDYDNAKEEYDKIKI